MVVGAFLLVTINVTRVCNVPQRASCLAAFDCVSVIYERHGFLRVTAVPLCLHVCPEIYRQKVFRKERGRYSGDDCRQRH